MEIRIIVDDARSPQLDRIERQLARLERRLIMDFAAIRAAVGALRSAIDALTARLQDNPTPEEISAVVSDLQGLTTSIDALDPDVPTGPIVEPPPV